MDGGERMEGNERGRGKEMGIMPYIQKWLDCQNGRGRRGVYIDITNACEWAKPYLLVPGTLE